MGIPEGMEDDVKPRFRVKEKNGRTIYMAKTITKKRQLKGVDEQCKEGVKQFDAYCHQYDGDDDDLRYTDFKGKTCKRYRKDPLKLAHCLAQDCMFDYCIARKEAWLEECIAEEGDIDLPEDEPGWGDVYNYGNMHGDLESNGGDWPNAICDKYYEYIETEEFEEAREE